MSKARFFIEDYNKSLLKYEDEYYWFKFADGLPVPPRWTPGAVNTGAEEPVLASRARDNVTKAGLSDKIEVLVGDALEIIPTLNDTFDLVFLDAAKDEYLKYLKLSECLLKTGGIVFADNAKTFADRMGNYLD